MSERRLYIDPDDDYQTDVLVTAVRAREPFGEGVGVIELDKNSHPRSSRAREDNVDAHDTPVYVFREGDERERFEGHDIVRHCVDHETHDMLADEHGFFVHNLDAVGNDVEPAENEHVDFRLEIELSSEEFPDTDARAEATEHFLDQLDDLFAAAESGYLTFGVWGKSVESDGTGVLKMLYDHDRAPGDPGQYEAANFVAVALDRQEIVERASVRGKVGREALRSDAHRDLIDEMSEIQYLRDQEAER